MNLEPLRIGSLTVQTPVFLAPMAGYTDAAFRSICREHGAGPLLTEMTNARGLLRKCPKTRHFLETVKGERPIGAHLYGSDPAVLAEAAALVEATGRFDFIDLNAGCPVSKIMNRGDGAGLLRNPEHLCRVVRAMRDAIRLPLTVKTRIGISPQHANASEAAQAIEEGGADALFLHARYAKDRHNGPPKWEVLARVKSERRLPVIGNGGIWKAEHAEAMIRQTGVDGIMIGRGAIGNPWIFEQIARRLAGQAPLPPLSPAEILNVIRIHLNRLVRLVNMETGFRRRSRITGEQAACNRFRGHLVKYLLGCPGLRALVRTFERLDTPEHLLANVEAVLQGRTDLPGMNN